MQQQWRFPNRATPEGSSAYYSVRFAPSAVRDDLAALVRAVVPPVSAIIPSEAAPTQGRRTTQVASDADPAGASDVLVGTSLVAKGLDVPEVTLVGVVNADVGIHLPDFRASERAFQLLSQVAGRTGHEVDVVEEVLEAESVGDQLEVLREILVREIEIMKRVCSLAVVLLLLTAGTIGFVHTIPKPGVELYAGFKQYQHNGGQGEPFRHLLALHPAQRRGGNHRNECSEQHGRGGSTSPPSS